MRWDLIAGEYPPQPGGVSDYTRQVADALAACGDEIHVWARPGVSAQVSDRAVTVHRLPDRFGPRTLAALGRLAGAPRRDRRWLVQYVPRAFGWKAMNVPFCVWLRARGRQEPVWTMFHEVIHPFLRRQPLSHNAMAAVTRVTAALVARGSARIFVSIPAWERWLRRLAPGAGPITWLPIPSSIPSFVSAETVALTRKRFAPEADQQMLGHFGTFGAPIRPLLAGALLPLLAAHPRRVAVLVGRGSEAFADELRRAGPALEGRLHATGGLAPDAVAAHLAACDVLLQPYPDGVSGRRSSVMAGLALGLPIVTTQGFLTEPLWGASEAVVLAPVSSPSAFVDAAASVLSDAGERRRLRERSLALYADQFTLDRTIATLRAADH